jgi:hypothetical protein
MNILLFIDTKIDPTLIEAIIEELSDQYQKKPYILSIPPEDKQKGQKSITKQIEIFQKTLCEIIKSLKITISKKITVFYLNTDKTLCEAFKKKTQVVPLYLQKKADEAKQAHYFQTDLPETINRQYYRHLADIIFTQQDEITIAESAVLDMLQEVKFLRKYFTQLAHEIIAMHQSRILKLPIRAEYYSFLHCLLKNTNILKIKLLLKRILHPALLSWHRTVAEQVFENHIENYTFMQYSILRRKKVAQDDTAEVSYTQ